MQTNSPTPTPDSAIAESVEARNRRLTIAFNGGISVPVIYQDKTTEDIKVRQIPVREYDAALKLLGNEHDLMAFFCVKPIEWLKNPPEGKEIVPDSLKELLDAMHEANDAGFFDWSGRRQQMDQIQQGRMLELLQSMSPEMMEQAFKLGASIQPSSSPTSYPPRRA